MEPSKTMLSKCDMQENDSEFNENDTYVKRI